MPSICGEGTDVATVAYWNIAARVVGGLLVTVFGLVDASANMTTASPRKEE